MKEDYEEAELLVPNEYCYAEPQIIVEGKLTFASWQVVYITCAM